jgi:exopolysaccharide biosynthesis polyprenyl glycosylphosphotransferase
LLIGSFFAGLLTCIVLYFSGAYRRESSLLNIYELQAVIKGVILAFILFTLTTYILRAHPSRYMVGFAFIYCMVFMVIQRTILYHLHPIIGKWLAIHKRVVIYGAGEMGTALYRQLVSSPKYNFLPVGFIDDDPDKRNLQLNCSGFKTNECISVLGGFDDLPDIVKEFQVNFIFVTISGIKNQHLETVFQRAHDLGIRVRFIPNLYRAFLHRLRIVRIGTIPLIEEVNPHHYFYRYLKRSFDLSVTLMLSPLILPLCIIIGILIKFDSKGPILFKHKRIGKHGVPYTLYKFRSMYTYVKAYSENPKSFNDKRITPFGRLLRKTSLDELPQLLNVLKGEMSLVGPRPEMPFIVEKYNEFHKERLKVAPGITGLWQLSGDRSKAIHDNMDYDLYYISNMSLFLDIAILIETIFFAFRGI